MGVQLWLFRAHAIWDFTFDSFRVSTHTKLVGVFSVLSVILDDWLSTNFLDLRESNKSETALDDKEKYFTNWEISSKN